MDTLLPQLGLVALLVLLNAAFAGSEIALISLREGQLGRLERDSQTGRVLARLARDPNRFLATIQIGITLAGFLASAVAAITLAEPLRKPLGFLGGAADVVAVILVTLALTFVTLVVGELAPKRVAMQRAERWGLIAARPLALLARITGPVIWLLGRSTDLAVRLFGGDPSRQREEVTQQELCDLVATQTAFTPEQRTIISGAFEIGERILRDVLVPRPRVFALRGDLPAAQGLRLLVASGHSRAPVVAGLGEGHPRASGDLDTVDGVVHLRDLLGDLDTIHEAAHLKNLLAGRGVVADHAQPTVILPETMRVVDALRQLQAERQQLAVVVDEHGASEGIVTVEDLVEELVGEIYDEVDPDVATVEHADDGSWVVPGSFPIHDLPDIGADFPEEKNYATVAGLMLDRLGHIPGGPGEATEVDGWHLEVLAVEGRAITRVRLTPPGHRASAGA